jgi:hypothetical protein
MSRRVDIDQLYADVNQLTNRHHDGRSRSHGLISELQDTAARVLTQQGGNDGSRAGKPGSRPPSSSSNNALDLLAEIETGVWQHDADLRDLLDAHLDYERPWLTALTALPGLVGRLPDAEQHPLAYDVHRSVRHWMNAAQLHMRHIAPMSRLNAACSYCGEQSLRVRSDASSDVVCVTPDCQDERGEQPRWTRDNWVLLLNAQDTA